MGLGSPEQPDLIQRGPATAEGGCERALPATTAQRER